METTLATDISFIHQTEGNSRYGAGSSRIQYPIAVHSFSLFFCFEIKSFFKNSIKGSKFPTNQ